MDKERNYGIDLLRIIAMLFIPMLHILGKGGILGALEAGTIKYEIVWCLEIMAYCAVNCYALISGFVGYGAKNKYANIMVLYLQVIFYTITISLIYNFICPTAIDIRSEIPKILLPFAYKTYWYFTAYFCMFFFIPLLNFVIENAGRSLMKHTISAIVILFSIVPAVFCNDVFITNGGYSALWLAMLYLIGAYIKKYDLHNKVSIKSSLFLYLICVAITIFAKLLIEIITKEPISIASNKWLYITYTSPTMLGAGTALLLCCARLKMGKIINGIIKFFAPAAFGVYLIHEEPLIRDNVITGKFADIAYLPPIAMVAAVIGSAIAIWFICSLIDKVRIVIFKFCRVKYICSLAEEKISGIIRE